MSVPQARIIDAGGRKPYTNAAPASANGELVTYEQLQGAIQSIAWKDDVRVATVTNISLAAPGAAIDGITMVLNDPFLAKDQSTQTQNGIYIWNGAATPATRRSDSDTFDELEGAIVTVSEGTNAGSSWRQTQVNGVIGTNNVIFTTFGAASAPASETSSGIAEIATQAETDAGTDDLRIVTPLKLKNSAYAAKRMAETTIGDGSANSFAITHNLGSEAVHVLVKEASGLKREVMCEKQYTSTTVVTLLFDDPPASNSLKVWVSY